MVRRASACALVAACLSAGCFYTTTINERPRADIAVSEGPYYPGTSISLRAANAFDADGGIRCRWSAATCRDRACTASDFIPGYEPTELSCAVEHSIELPTDNGGHLPIQIVLEVSDDQGATFPVTRVLEIGNRQPTLQVQARPAGTADHAVVNLPIEVAVEVDDPDEDAVALSWRLIKPRGAAAEVDLVEVTDVVRTFRPDVVGLWSVEVTADDGFATASATGSAAVAPDGPPCIDLTSPAAGPDRLILRRSDSPRVFSVLLVADDLDPFPRPAGGDPALGEPGFTWHIASPDTGGELVPVTGADGADLVLDPSVYAPGDLVDLRVEVADRVARPSACPGDQPSCSATGDDCYQRLGWAVEIR